jgi:formylglycine-generating enzyme required for sulfatase activity
MSKVFFSCFPNRIKRINIFILVGAIIFLSLAVFNDVYGAAQASAKAGSSKKSETVVLEPKYPRPNEMLQGVVYDLKRTKDLKPTNLIGNNMANANKQVDGDVFAAITKPFVNGPASTWRNTTDNRGNIRFPYFDNYYYCLPNRLYNSFFYMEGKERSEAPKMLHAEGDLQGGGWISIYSGYVVAPFTGTFRFVGFADDAILVRFNKNIVLDYGWYSLTMGARLETFSSRYREILSGKLDPTAAQKSKIQESALFSKFKMDVWSANSDNGNGHGLQRGVPIKVQKGQVFPIEIVITELGEGSFFTMLFVEQLDSSGNPQNANPDKLPLFRTTAHLPPHPTLDWFPDFEESGPIWKVVDFSGNPIPASRYTGQKYKIGFQEDGPDSTGQKATASATASTKNNAVEYEDELPGVFYDLKLTSNGESTGLMEMQEGKQFNLNRMRTMKSVWNLPETAGKESVMVPYLKRFVVSNWPSRTDSTGNLFFSEFSQFSRSPINSYKSYFYQSFVSSESAPRTYSGDGRVSDTGWIGINSGYVIAPFTGTFRFVGCGDDALVVRFDNQIVLDYGVYALSLGKKLDDTWEWKAILGGTAAKTDPQNRMVLNNPVYSRCKLETYFPSAFDRRGLAKGVPISVTKGKHYPIQILVADIEQNRFGTALLVERLDSKGVPLKTDPATLPLFRTSSALPSHSSGSGFSDFDENSPIWKVVDSNGKPIPSHKLVVAETSSQTQQKNQTEGPPKKDNSKQVVTKEKNEKDFASTGIINLPGDVKMELIRVEAGTFTMSAKDGDNRHYEIAHQATIEKDFYLAKTEVTQAQWKAVMNSNPSGFKGDDLPVETVSWNDAMEFCEKLNATGKAPSGWMFTLPTETQWEYGARGGNQSKGYKYSGSNNLDEVAWYYENSGDERQSDSAWSEDRLSSNHCRTHPVGTKKANELGLYDMSGNLYEWCLDDWREDGTDKLTAEFTRENDTAGMRSIRGGGWGGSAINCRSSFRVNSSSDFRKNDLGFRVVLVPVEKPAKSAKSK